MEIFSAKVFLPLFYVRYGESWGIRLSSRLPSPRTILGALAKGLGIILGIESGETLIKGRSAREVLMEAVELSSYGFVRPLSPLVKTSQILRIVPAIEQNKVYASSVMGLSGEAFIKAVSSFHDAFKHDIVFSNEMELVYVVSIEELNEKLSEYGCREVKWRDVLLALKMIDRIGSTEALGGVLSVKHVKYVRKVGKRATVNTYVPVEEPAVWVETLHEALNQYSGGYLIEPLYPNLRLIHETKITKKNRAIKINFVLPLLHSAKRKGREIFEPTNVPVVSKGSYEVYSIDGAGDGETRIVLHKKEVKDKIR